MLLNFYGKECPHCHEMEPVIDQLEKDTGVKVDRLEVWHNDENMKTMEKYDKNLCGGVPFFFNTENGKFVCGETSLEDLKDWAGK